MNCALTDIQTVHVCAFHKNKRMGLAVMWRNSGCSLCKVHLENLARSAQWWCGIGKGSQMSLSPLCPLSPWLCLPPPDFVPPPWTVHPLQTLSTTPVDFIHPFCGLCPPRGLCAPPAEWYLRQSTKSLVGQFAIIIVVIRGNIHYSGLRTAVALSTASLVCGVTTGWGQENHEHWPTCNPKILVQISTAPSCLNWQYLNTKIIVSICTSTSYVISCETSATKVTFGLIWKHLKPRPSGSFSLPQVRDMLGQADAQVQFPLSPPVTFRTWLLVWADFLVGCSLQYDVRDGRLKAAVRFMDQKHRPKMGDHNWGDQTANQTTHCSWTIHGTSPQTRSMVMNQLWTKKCGSCKPNDSLLVFGSSSLQIERRHILLESPVSSAEVSCLLQENTFISSSVKYGDDWIDDVCFDGLVRA